jgi:hypothetical protein
MKNIASTALLRLYGACILMLFTHLAHAQYAWVDEKGVRHYSDRPPPPSTPAAKILKSPQKQNAEPQEAEPAAAPADMQKVGTRPTLAEREADFRKRAQEQAKDEKKAAEDAAAKQAQAENCASARQYKNQLESGIRVAETDEKGERAFLSDEDRAKRLAKTNKTLEACR